MTRVSLDQLPTVTAGMLLDFLADFEVQCAPAASRRAFRWFSAPEEFGLDRPACVSGAQLLQVCRMEEARRLLEADEHAFVCALNPEAALPPWADAYAERFVAVRQTDSRSYFLLCIQRLFSEMMIWENELDRVVWRHGGLDALLAVGSSLIEGRIECLDSTGTLLAHSGSSGAQTAAPSAAGARGAEGGEVRVPISVGRAHVATLVLVRDPVGVTVGVRDALEALAARAEALCREIWRDQMRAESPYQFALAQLVERGPRCAPPDARLLAQMGIPENAQYKLLVLDLEHVREEVPLVRIVRAASLANRGAAQCFTYRDDVCVLCFAPEGDSQLSHKKTSHDVDRLLGTPFGVRAASSQIFESITDLDLAYREAVMARSLRPILEAEEGRDEATREGRVYGRGERGAYAVVPFESCLLYYLVGATEKDERFLSFAFSHTLLKKISEEDAAHGTNDLEMFWLYLANERNATAVAERLHMHRNTVIYHIDKIQKRFDLDLSQQSVREKMIIDFKVFFLMQHRISVEQLLREA